MKTIVVDKDEASSDWIHSVGGFGGGKEETPRSVNVEKDEEKTYREELAELEESGGIASSEVDIENESR